MRRVRIAFLIAGLLVSSAVLADSLYRRMNNDCGVAGHVPCDPIRFNVGIKHDDQGPYFKYYDQVIRPQYPGAWDR